MRKLAPTQWVRFGKEEQRHECALIFAKNRSKRYKACSDAAADEGSERRTAVRREPDVPTRSPLRGNRSGMTTVRVRIPVDFASQKKKKPSAFAEGLAADEGFEPSQTESESGVLPLH